MPGPVVDLHGHWFPPAVVGRLGGGGTPSMRAAWPLLQDLDAQMEACAAAGTDVRVVSAPLSSVLPAASVPTDQIPTRINDELAAAVAAGGGRLEALATVDAFAGDLGALEARRAVEELGLRGLVVDAVSGDRLLDAPEARATLAFAAERGVPVFAHPVTPSPLPARFARPGGVLLARGTESALSTLALLDAGLLEELAGLEVVLAGIGAAALLLAPFLDSPTDQHVASRQRTRLTVDTMGFDPEAARFLLDVLGPERVVVGSDWPIMWREASAERVATMLEATGLPEEHRRAVAGGNARRLLGLRP